MKRLILLIPVLGLLMALGALWVYGAPNGVGVSTSCVATQIAASVQDSAGNALIPLQFVYGASSQTYNINCTIPLGAPSTFLGDFVGNTCNNLTNQSVAFSSAPGVGLPVPPTPVAAPDPNAQIESQFVADYLLLRHYKALVNQGVIVSTDPTYIAQQTTVQNEFNTNRSILLPLVPAGP